MREYVGLTANIGINEDEDGAIVSAAEVVLLTSDTEYLIVDGKLHQRRRAIDVFRFGATREGLDLMIKGLERIRADLQKFEERVTVEPLPQAA